jgi:uncharacterized membrane protein
MSPLHIHLILTHAPLFGLLISLLLLLVAIWRRSDELKKVAFGLLVLSALVTLPLYFTGEAAEEAVERLPGVAKGAIDPHEYAAKIAFAGILVTGAVALAGFVLFRRGRLVPKWFTSLVLVLSLVTVSLMAWTANLGGKVRHTELGGGGAVSASKTQPEEDHETH